jgi:AraC-like DNA-binding protein
MRVIYSWSSENLPERERLRGWRDTMHSYVLEMDCVPRQRDGFFARIERCPLLRTSPHQAWGAPQQVSRSAVEIARGNRNAYYLLSQPRLPWHVAQAGRASVLQPGDAVLVDSREPYRFDFGAGLEDLSIELPIDWVAHWVAQPSQLIGRPLRADAGWGRALRVVKEMLAPRELHDGAEEEDQTIEAQLGGLLSLLGGTGHRHPASFAATHERILTVMRARFMQPGLSAAEVAMEAGLSLRTLHRAMAARDSGFLDTLMALRIDAAALMLAQSRFRSLSIAEVGHRCGFADASHFARQFARRQKVAPLAFRAQRQR